MDEIIKRAADSCGGASALAAKINVSPQVVSNWRARGVPAAQCPLIEKATGGAVTCDELRPDLSWGRLPDLEWHYHPQGRPVLDVAREAA